nr:hypothetical protein [Pseudomonas sp. LPH1]
MPYHIKFERPPMGVAISSARSGEEVAVAYREFTSSEDGDFFISRLESFPSVVINLLQAYPEIKPSLIDHLVVLIEPDGSADVYINELKIIGKVRIRRSVQKGDPIFDGDIVDIEAITFEGLEIPDDVAVMVLFSQGWRKGLFFDFGPILPTPIKRDFSLSHVLGGYYSYLAFQQYFKVTDDEWNKLLASGWFPFIGLQSDALKSLIEHIRNDWDPDQLLVDIASDIKDRMQQLKAAWATQELLSPHLDLFCHALGRFEQEDYISATAIFYPRIEGLLRSMQSISGGTSFKQDKLIEAPLRIASEHTHQYSRLLPDKFQKFLETVYFASFTPDNVTSLSRHTVSHGVAPSELYSLKAAVLGVLIVEQLCFHLPPRTSTYTTS